MAAIGYFPPAPPATLLAVVAGLAVLVAVTRAGEDLRTVWLEPGQGAFWQAGEWYMFRTGPLGGSCEILELHIEGRDLDEFLTFPEEDAASNGSIGGTQEAAPRRRADGRRDQQLREMAKDAPPQAQGGGELCEDGRYKAGVPAKLYQSLAKLAGASRT